MKLGHWMCNLKPYNEEESLASKTDKYKPTYKNRVIPVVIEYFDNI